VYDPATGDVSEEIVADGPVAANAWGGRTGSEKGLSLTGPNFSVNGSAEAGYHFEFRGTTVAGMFDFSNPVAGRSECHKGVSNTRYGLYQVPMMNVTGSLRRADDTVARRVCGVGYHDHWWCIAHRVTRWNWMQAKFTGGWTLTASGPAGSLRLEARPRAERYELKPVVLAGLLLGEVQYFQYPVTVKAVYTPVAGAPATLESDSGMLEWDWVAVW